MPSLSGLPTLPGLAPGELPPIPSAAPGASSDVPLPSGTLGSLGATMTGLGSQLSSLSSLLGLSGSLTSPVAQTAANTPGKTTAANTSNGITDITPDGFVARIAYVLLGIVVIAGAIYTYVK